MLNKLLYNDNKDGIHLISALITLVYLDQFKKEQNQVIMMAGDLIQISMPYFYVYHTHGY